MKKIFALAIMAMFVFSILPVAFAEEGSDSVEVSAEADAEVKSDTSAETDTGSASGSGSAGVSNEISIRQRIKADLREDVRDAKEDVRDSKEDIRDAANVDRVRCMEKCKVEATQSGDVADARLKARCEVRCKAVDKRENVLDKREDMKDRLEDHRERNRQMLAKIAALDQRQIERLSNLDVDAVEKISMLKKERLDRLSALTEEKIERLSELAGKDLEKVTDLSNEELQKLALVSRSELKELAEKDPARLRAELRARTVLKVRDADDLDKREVSEEKLAQLKLRYNQAKDRFNQTKEDLKEIKSQLRQAKDEGDEEAVLERAKEYLLKTADSMISHLEKLKAKVSESENIEADLEAKIVAGIDSHIADLNSIKAEISAAKTKEEIKQASAKLRQKWNTLRHIARLFAERIVSSRVEGIVNHGLVLEKRLDHILGKMEEKGITVDVSAEVEVFSSHMADAREYHAQASAKLSEAMALKDGSAEEVKQLVDEAKSLLKQSRNSVKAAHEVLKDIVKKIKEAEPKADLSQEVEIEVVSEASSSESA